MTLSPDESHPGAAAGAGRDAADPAVALVPTGVFGPAGITEIIPGATGRFRGAALFLDVSGFTSLSERLGRQGSAGTEELVRILNGFFEPSIDLVREAGGEVVAFGGDAITAVWPGPDALTNAVACASRLIRLAQHNETVTTSLGEFGFAVRIGVAAGAVDVTVGGHRGRLSVLSHGEAIDRAVDCEHDAEPGTVVAREADGSAYEAADEGTAPSPSSKVSPPPTVDPAGFAHPVTVERLRRGDTTLIDGHRRVTTVFARLPAPEPADAIRLVVDVAEDLGGEVIQITGGDKGTVALMAFGAPTSCPDDTCRAMAAGSRLTRDLPGTSVGISTGTVFAGQVGGPARSVSTVIGDPVNLAARLMQAAEEGSVLVDEPSALAADATFAFDGWRQIPIKGKDERAQVAHLTGQRRRIWPTNRLATDGPMLGRAHQLARAERALEARKTGVRRVVIRGPAGIGKSRFARALADRADARGWHVVAGGFAGFSDVAPYAAWQPVLRSILSIDGGGEVALEHLLGGSDDLAPLLGPLIGRRVPETDRSAALEGELRSELAEELAVRVIEAAASTQPLVIELEDWHWADRSSARLLEALTTRPMSSPITVVITQRMPLEGLPLTKHEGDVVIDLDEVDDDVARDIATSVLARTGTVSEPERIARIVELGAGNPLMVETLVDVGDVGVLTTGLAPMLQARLDGLGDTDLRALLWASAFGRPVTTDELETAMAEGHEPSVDISDRLGRLVSGGLLATVRSTEGALDFRHASVREAAYERLSHGSRRRVHHGVALMLEDRDEQPMEIAHHLAQTDDVDRQLRWFPRAGIQARTAWAVDDAIAWFERARAIGDSSDDVRISLAEMEMVTGDLDRVAGLVVEPCADQMLDVRRSMLLGERSTITGDIEGAVEVLTGTLRRARGTDSEAVAAAELLSRALVEVGRFDEAAEVAQMAIEGVDADDHDTMARAIGAYGTVQIHRFDLEGAVATLERAVDEAEAGVDLIRRIHLQSDLAMACAMSGDIAASLEALFSAREIAQRIGYRRHIALSVSNEAETRLSLDDRDAVTTLSLRALTDAQALGDIGLACDNLLRLGANPALSTSDRLAILERAMGLEASLGRAHLLIEWATLSIEIAAVEPDQDPAERAEAVLAEARELGRPDLELRVLSALGARADLAALDDLGSRLEEPGDRFLLDMERRRITNDHGDDDDLRVRGLELYRRAPFAVYRDGLAELGIQEPPTDVVIPPMEASDDDPVYSLPSVMDLIESLERQLDTYVSGRRLL